ncbi:hypothetical protein Trydic_g1318 [Trypoxylus dichotomus]
MLTVVCVKERPKTFEGGELEVLLDENIRQTQQEPPLALGVTLQAISKRLHALGMIQRQGTSVPYDLKPRALSVVSSPVNNCSSCKKGRVFSSHRDGSLEQPKEKKVMGIARSCFYEKRPQCEQRH